MFLNTIQRAIALSLAASAVSALPVKRQDFKAQNGRDAQAQNAEFFSLTADSACTDGQNACVEGSFAQCVNGQFTIFPCGGGLQCFSLPLVNSPGTSLTCTTQQDAEARIQSSGASGGVTGSGSGSGSTGSSSQESSGGDNSASGGSSASSTGSAPVSSSGAGFTTPGEFVAQNGRDAQAQNAQFASLTADSTCNDGELACVQGSFAQCVGGQFTITSCGSGTLCFALPLVNRPGTSITCTTEQDATARIQSSGATGGITEGSESSSSTGSASGAVSSPATGSSNGAVNSSSNAAATGSASDSDASGDFKTQNGKDAQAQNAQFASMTADSPCSDGEQACVEGGFAQCVGGQFTITQCAGGTQCFALPLVNKPATSITCTTEQDAAARIQASGATGGITGA